MTDINLGEGTNLGICGGNTALGAGIGGFIGSWFGNGGLKSEHVIQAINIMNNKYKEVN